MADHKGVNVKQRTCRGCGTSFDINPRERNPRQWCSGKCRAWHLKHPDEPRPTDRTCGHCGKGIDHMTISAKWCSPECGYLGRGGGATKEDRQCPVCRKRFTAAGNKNGVFMVHFARALHAFVAGDFEAALTHSDLANPDERSAAGTVLGQEYPFIRGLILTRCAERSPRRSAMLREARARRKTLRGWQVHCPHNLEHKADLIDAGIARLEGRDAASPILRPACGPRKQANALVTNIRNAGQRHAAPRVRRS